MFLGGDCDVIPGCAEGADPESRGESSLSPDSGFGPSARPGMTWEEACPGMTEETAAPGLDGACAKSRSHRYCATLVSWYSSTRMNLKRLWYCRSTSGC